MTTTNVEKIREQLIGMAREPERWDLMELWNVYCDEKQYSYDIIYYNRLDDMDNYFSSIGDFYRHLGHYHENDDFFCFDGYENINSFNCLDSVYSPINFDLLAEWLADDESTCEQYGIEIDDE